MSMGSQLVHLVYAQQNVDGPEPLVAVVATEEEASQIEVEAKVGHPGGLVRWETHEVVDGPSGVVYALLLEAGGPHEGEPTDPIGIAVYADEQSATARLHAEESVQPGHFVVQYPVGWRRPGWPFDA